MIYVISVHYQNYLNDLMEVATMKRSVIVSLTVFICVLPLLIAFLSLPAAERSLPSFSLKGLFNRQEPSSSRTGEEQTPWSTDKSTENMTPAEKLYEQGYKAYMNKDYDTAIQHFSNSLDLDNKCYQSLNGMGIVLCFKGEHDLGMAYIDRAIELNPDYLYAYFNKGLAFALIRDFENAIQWYDKAIELNPDDPQNAWSYYGKACIYAKMDDLSRCVANLSKAIEMDASVKDAAKTEEDFDNVRNREQFSNLFE